MDLQLKSRCALITGAGTGIGRATAVTLAREGVGTVVVHCHQSRGPAEQTAAEVRRAGARCEVVAADLTDDAAVAALHRTVADRCGPVHILVNNAGSVLRRSAFVDSTVALWTQSFDVNLLSAYRVTRAFVREMIDEGWGRIVFVSSIAARTGSPRETTHYAVAKAGLVVMAKGLSGELAPFGITVNAVAPGFIRTPLHDKFSDPARVAKIIAGTPVNREGTADEVAACIAFLAGSQSGYLTGETLYLTGGR